MGENVLVADNPRMGWLIDGDPKTPEIAAMLRDTGTDVTLTVPTKGLWGSDDPYARWFAAGISYGDDPDRSEYSYRPPRVVMFHDHDGSVVLVGCRAAGMYSTMSAGTGRIVANYAVLGGRNLKYEKVNGVRTELPSLAL